jgi:ATP-dependent Lon protease
MLSLMMLKKVRSITLRLNKLEKYLGPVKFDSTSIEEEPQVGLVNGLAWTSVGGELLNIEVVTVPGTRKNSSYR